MLFAVPLIAGIYGIMHDQITYSICSEYFTNFKFIQFRISPELRESERLASALVGLLATWWVGVPIGIILGPIGIQSLEWKTFLTLKMRAIAITFVVAILFGVAGYLLGLIGSTATFDKQLHIQHLAGYPEMYEALLQVKDVKGFIVVGYIHTFSYLGGLVGMMIALFYQFRKVRFLRKTMKKIFNAVKEDELE
jgi:hypothetical protein